ncbi:uncharacterized protein LOC116616176 [Nematostella vectensis]|uniref:uncharacterized protein LOC116616176 n=1 Tax=Nematostella vectensis TaxID=45351 RepID=UPI0020770703|nr:uncharacterized protein LOC116616176 [Nematostella vectensis]
MSTEHAWYMVDRLREILKSDYFDKDSFDERRLKLSQAFCLMWQDKENGEVSGRQKSGPPAAAAIVAVLIDLLILEKIEFEVEVKQWMTRRREIIYVKVAEDKPCGTFLDKALFSSILRHHKANPDKPKTVNEWIIHGCSAFPTCVTEILESLVNMEILDKKDVLFWRKYPTKNLEPKSELTEEIRKIALSAHPADGYMWTLLKLMKDVDACAFRKGTFFPKYFSENEIGEANASIAKLTSVQVLSEAGSNEIVAMVEINGERSDEGSKTEDVSTCKPEDVDVVEKAEGEGVVREKREVQIETEQTKEGASTENKENPENDVTECNEELPEEGKPDTEKEEEKDEKKDDGSTEHKGNPEKAVEECNEELTEEAKPDTEREEKKNKNEDDKKEEGTLDESAVEQEEENLELDKETLQSLNSSELNTKM